MEHKYFEETSKLIRNMHDVDPLWDIACGRDDHVILMADITNMKHITLQVLISNLTVIGLPDTQQITLQELLEYFDRNNNYARVAGHNEYYNLIVDDMMDFNTPTNVTFPLSNNAGRRWIRFLTHPVKDHPNLFGVHITEVTKYLIAEEELFLKTHVDSLTNVFNKYTMDYHYGERYQHDNLHVLFLDLDNFKQVNDHLGHQEGNRLLQEFAAILLSYEKDYNRFYRLGGDEFVGLFFESSDMVQETATNILEDCRSLFKDLAFANVSVSIGVVQATKREDVIRKADRLMYQAKNLGKNQIVFSSEDDL